jgi:hypothetical protein
VRNGQRGVFRDEVLWDVGNPVNGSEPYALRVCSALGLGADWFDAIRTHVQQQLDDVKQVGADAGVLLLVLHVLMQTDQKFGYMGGGVQVTCRHVHHNHGGIAQQERAPAY